MNQYRSGWAGVIKREPQVVRDAAKAEARRVVGMKAHATPPVDVGPVPVAPARGPQRVVTDWVALPGGTRRALGKRLEEADVFDVMHAQASRRHGDADAAFVAPFTPGQIGMARHYRTLTERHAAGGVRCSSLEAGRGGGVGDDRQRGAADLPDVLAQLQGGEGRGLGGGGGDDDAGGGLAVLGQCEVCRGGSGAAVVATGEQACRPGEGEVFEEAHAMDPFFGVTSML
jgi:hypothetical protein